MSALDGTSDKEIFQRLLELTQSGRMDWKQVYEGGGTHPTEDIKESTAPQGYLAVDEYFGFGRAAVEPEDPEDGIEHAVVHVSGNRLSLPEGYVEELIGAIEDYIDAVQAGKTPSAAERINRKIQEKIEPLQHQIRSLEEQVARRDHRIDRMLTVLEHTTRPEGAPILTVDNFREVFQNLDFNIPEADSEDPYISTDDKDVENAIEDL